MASDSTGPGPPPGPLDGSQGDPLTARELLVLGHLAKMRTAEEIAVMKFVSVATVRSDTRSIVRKLRAPRDDDTDRPHLRIVPPDSPGGAAPQPGPRR